MNYLAVKMSRDCHNRNFTIHLLKFAYFRLEAFGISPWFVWWESFYAMRHMRITPELLCMLMSNLKWNFIVLCLRVDLNLLWHSRLVLYKTFWFQKSWKFSYYVPSMDKMNNGPPELVPFELLHLELGTMAWQFISRRDWLIDGWSFYVWLMDGWQCCGSRSGAFLTPGSGKGFFFLIPEPKPIFLRSWWQFLGKKVL